MTRGTKSVLFGVHCFFIHPFFVAWGWWKLYGFPCDPRLWLAFFLHDIGYLGKPNIDGAEGEQHPYTGARLMNFFCDYQSNRWYWFTLLHSRHLAKSLGMHPSQLAFADKMAIVLEPSWLYIPRARASGEMAEYLRNAREAKPDAGGEFRVPGATEALDLLRKAGLANDAQLWHNSVKAYMELWLEHNVAETQKGTL